MTIVIRHDIGILIYRELLYIARKVMEKSIFTLYLLQTRVITKVPCVVCFYVSMHSSYQFYAPMCQSMQYILIHKVTEYNCHMPVTIYRYIVIKC